MEGQEGVPLRSPRPVMALIATGIAASTFALATVPASASGVRGSEWWLSTLKVRQAWTTSKGAGVTVAVLSDGVDASQPDLTGAVTSGPDLTGTSQSSGPYFGQVGTGLASLIAGHGHGPGDDSGIVGVAPQARILSVRVTLPSDDPLLAQSSVAARLPGAIAAGIRYAVNHGATVIDLPLDPGQPGVSGTGDATAAAGGSAAEQSAVNYALGKNVVLVAPAGDDGSGTDAANYPAAYPGVIAVGAFNQAFVKASWSSKQSYVTVTAAGDGVIAATNSGGYQTISSTAAASAVTAGIVALIRSRFPNLSVPEVRRALTTSTVFNGKTAGSGAGTVNAERALTAAAAQAPAGAPAAAGALPWSTPAAPAAHSEEHSFTVSLIRDAIVSAGLLVVLLLLIALYVAAGRRRAVRKQEAVAAEWAGRHGQSRYPSASSADPEHMLEFFAAAPITAPAGSPDRLATRPSRPSRPRGPAAAPGLFATANRESEGPQVTDRPVTSRLGGPAPASSAWAGADAGRSGFSPATREVSKRPPVSGTPPWEPASQPDSDLPWVTSQGPAVGRPVPTRPATGTAAATGTPAAPRTSAPRAGYTSPFGPASQSGGPASPSGPGIPPGGTASPSGAGIPPGAALPAAVSRPAVAGRASWAAHGAHSAHAARASHSSHPAHAATQPRPIRPATSQVPTEQAPWEPTEQAPWEPTEQAPWEPTRQALWEQQPEPAESFTSASGPEGTWPPEPDIDRAPSQRMTGRLDWGQDVVRPVGPAPAEQSTQPAPSPEQHPGGPLPVRQPRQRAQTPLSPSGSLWERAVEPAGDPAISQDSAGQPIYVWNPSATTNSFPTAGESADGITEDLARWGMRYRQRDAPE